MERLFNVSKRYVKIYSSNSDELKDKAKHVKHRKLIGWNLKSSLFKNRSTNHTKKMQTLNPSWPN